MRRILVMMIGLLLTGAGCMPALLAVYGIYSGSITPLLAAVLILAISLVFLSLGIITLRRFSYETTFGAEGMAMKFVFRSEQISLSDVEWYRNLVFRTRFLGGANVWVLMKYKEREAQSRMVVLLLSGIGPTVGTATRQFTTPLDTIIPDKGAPV